ncbi:MAG TPA: nitroreductase family deazaflavin-dependent oxidoreductase [Actinomycetota bacterium]|nr:nitroreductase family deazaflavin-dependent oxidoreductase [Actinomycetota bacterium]
MPLPAWLARFNRRVSNPALRPVAASMPGFGVLVHRGRTSGRTYRTPVNAFATRDGFVIALTYGSDVDWVKNVLAEGACELIHRGERLSLVRPVLVKGGVDTSTIPGPIRAFLRLIGVTDYVRLERQARGPG